jgi:hypothetical protein
MKTNEIFATKSSVAYFQNKDFSLPVKLLFSHDIIIWKSLLFFLLGFSWTTHFELEFEFLSLV